MARINKTKLTKFIKHDYFSIENIKKFPERLVIVGFIAADGCIVQPKTGQRLLVFNIAQKDRIALDIINKELCKGLRNLAFLRQTKSFMLTIPSDEICCDLERFNIVQRKTRIYDLPTLDMNDLPYFLRGYFYGDGCISDGSKYHPGIFLIGTKMFSESLERCLIENDIVDRIGIYPIKHSKCCLQLALHGRMATKFSKYIFHNKKMMLIPRKHKILKDVILNSWWTNEERELLKTVPIEEFCKITKRSKETARVYFANFKRTGMVGRINI